MAVSHLWCCWGSVAPARIIVTSIIQHRKESFFGSFLSNMNKPMDCPTIELFCLLVFWGGGGGWGGFGPSKTTINLSILLVFVKFGGGWVGGWGGMGWFWTLQDNNQPVNLVGLREVWIYLAYYILWMHTRHKNHHLCSDTNLQPCHFHTLHKHKFFCHKTEGLQ